eukprot:m.338723 g.338723  ORF g.338723 m.338723 type:complete len:292 (+) comp18521_c0_seq1:74-949(+)
MTVSWREARTRLKSFRDSKERNSIVVVTLAKPLIDGYSHRLGDEYWTICEQACMAAIDCGNTELEEKCYNILKTKFGEESIRVSILRGLGLEGKEEWKEATKLYGELLKKDETNAMIMKRQVCVLLGMSASKSDEAEAKKAHTEAIKQLNDYLQIYQCDFEAWMQLADLHLKSQNYPSALFCYEELMLSNPFNYVFHLRYAEILYTMGGVENLSLALKYYAKAAHLNSDNARVLMGLLLTAEKLNTGKATTMKANTNAPDLAKKAKELLRLQYKGVSNESLLQGLLDLMKD